MFNPREAAILRYHGIDLDALAPKADESKKSNKMEDGGNIPKSQTYKDRYKPRAAIESQIGSGPIDMIPLSTGLKTPTEKEISYKMLVL